MPSEPSTPSPESANALNRSIWGMPRLAIPLLAGIVALAFALRATLIGYGLPLLLYEDEPIYYHHALQLGLGQWDASYFKKPGFFLCFYGSFYYLGYLFSGLHHWRDYLDAFQRNPTGVAHIGRFVSVALAAGTVYQTGRLGMRLFGWSAGLAAALWLALDLTHLRISPVVIADIPALFWIVTAARFAVNVRETGRWRDYLLCAASIALAVSFKYNVFTVFFLLAAHFMPREGEQPGNSSFAFRLDRLRSARLWGSLALIPALFLLLNPMTFFHFSAFWRDINLEKNHMMLRHAEQAGSSHWRFMAAFPAIFFRILPKALGWPIYLAGLSGFWLIFRKGTLTSRAVFVFPLIFLGVVSQFQLINAKYLLPASLFWFLAAAVALKTVSSCIFKRAPKAGAAYALLVLLFALPSLAGSLRYLSIYTRPDTRLAAAQTLRRMARPTDRVLLEPDTLTLDPHIIRSGWQWQTLEPLSRSITLPTAESSTSKAFPASEASQSSTRYVLMNLGNTRKVDDAPAGHRYEMPYPASYYAWLQTHYTPKRLFSPYPIRRSNSDLQREWRAHGFPALYERIQQNKGSRRQPGPLLLLMERDS